MYDKETNAPKNRSERKTNAMGDLDGQRNPVHLCFGYGHQLYAWPLGQRSGQRRNIQNDFTRFFYTYRRHDWIPVWYQTYAK